MYIFGLYVVMEFFLYNQCYHPVNNNQHRDICEHIVNNCLYTKFSHSDYTTTLAKKNPIILAFANIKLDVSQHQGFSSPV